jgi:predicted RNA-binding Zn-ribbon protein involved in translation (DUF1610 family)
MVNHRQTIQMHPKDCKGCGREMAPKLPPTEYIIEHSGKIGVRCKECRQINECRKKATTA